MPNQDFNIDDLKKSWQEQPVPEVYQSSEIEAMLNKSSRNYVKYILWISIAEFLFFAAVSIYSVFYTDQTSSFLHIIKKLGAKITYEIEKDFTHLFFFFKVLSLSITAVFVVLFYRNYKKINIENNLKNFILQIIKFKRTVNLFILTNIIVLIFFAMVLTIFSMNILKLQEIQLQNATLIGIVVGAIVSVTIGLLLILIYYRVVYGIIMRRLGNKLQQLQKIEQEQ